LDDIFLLQSDQRATATLVGSLSPPYRVRVATELRELEGLLEKAEPQACVLDIAGSPISPSLPSLRRLRRGYPTLCLIIASDFSGREMDLYHLGRLNVDGVIRLEDRPSARDILSLVENSIAAALATHVAHTATGDHPPLVQEAVRWAIEHADNRPQVSELAAALAMSPRAFLREMKALDFGPPRALLLWGRLIRASHLLERSSQSVESIAFRLGYSTGGALGKALKRHVGHSPTELLECGGLACTLEVFLKKGLAPAGETVPQ
jgi:AraC-like DNA-binding protein